MSQSPDYQKGYAAGRRRLETDIALGKKDDIRNEQWLKFFTAMLPATSDIRGWVNTLSDGTKKPINSIPDRVKLASDFADEAIKRAAYQGRIK